LKKKEKKQSKSITNTRTEPKKVPEEPVIKTEDEIIDEKISKATVITLNDSLFDRHKSKDFESNIQYMTREYGFFIPEVEHLKDFPGLIQYLGQKISIGNTCIYCQKTFYSLEATQNHMRSLSHCKILWEDNEDEYGDFYDFEADGNKITEDDPENEYVLVSGNNELVIAKNKIVGHRSLQVYYKQRPHGGANQQLVASLMQEHKRIQAIERQQDITPDRKALNLMADRNLKYGMKNNNQARYRNQNPL